MGGIARQRPTHPRAPVATRAPCHATRPGPDVGGPNNPATPNQCVTAPNTAGYSCQIGYLGGTPYFGRDLNGDGDLLDTVRVVAPSQTATHRYGVSASLRYDINENNTVRIISE